MAGTVAVAVAAGAEGARVGTEGGTVYLINNKVSLKVKEEMI